MTRNEHNGEEDDNTRYRVVLNDEGQYSIWPVDRDCPAGWREEGTSGTRAECLAHIDAVWTDITPLSVRRAREADHQS